jgi:hypothetical protein
VFAGIVIPALPLTSGMAEELYAPLVNTTLPVADGAPDPPLTFTVTGNAWPATIFCEAAVTFTVGVDRLTVMEALPEALLYTEELAASGV